MWLEEGVSELPPSIRRWIYLGTVFGPNAVPIVAYGCVMSGIFLLIFVFIRAYKNFLFDTDPKTLEILELGRKSLRRGSSFLINHQHRLIVQRDSYILLKQQNYNSSNINNNVYV